jgi:threonine dehydrogenase-like Zn-dependent dehydrogenase
VCWVLLRVSSWVRYWQNSVVRGISTSVAGRFSFPTAQQCIGMAPQRGKIVPVGVCEQPDHIMPFFGLVKELQIQFAIAYTRNDFETCVAMLAERRIDVSPMITDIVSLDELPEAFEALRTPSHQCKVLTRFY